MPRAGEVCGMQLGVGVEEGAGVGAPRVHLHTVRLPNLLEGFFHLHNEINIIATSEFSSI